MRTAIVFFVLCVLAVFAVAACDAHPPIGPRTVGPAGSLTLDGGAGDVDAGPR